MAVTGYGESVMNYCQKNAISYSYGKNIVSKSKVRGYQVQTSRNNNFHANGRAYNKSDNTTTKPKPYRPADNESNPEPNSSAVKEPDGYAKPKHYRVTDRCTH